MGGHSRRSVLAALAGTALTAGCSRVLGTGSAAVEVLCAGSLQRPMLTLADRVDVPVRVEARGSAAATRLVADGVRDPDVLAVADETLFESVLDPDWYARIATNELCVAYDRNTSQGRQIATADRWFDPIAAGDVGLGRTDPDLDPLGYRTLFAFELAADYYDRPGLARRLRSESEIYPETSLLARLDTGTVGAAVVYRSMARDHGYDTVDLPAEIDLSDPEYADRYGTVDYELSEGTRVTGGVIDYVATVRATGDGPRTVFETLAAGELLADHGFRLPDRYPAFIGDVPDGLSA